MSQHPLCFVLMPFGIKPAGGRLKVDFDAVYGELIKPAILEAGLEPLRADEEMAGGIIHKPMFERLLLCPYAVADLTTANANVFYELGVRHAVKASSTALIYAEGVGKPTFDLAPLRGLPYSLGKDGKPDDVAADVAKLAARLKAARDHAIDSPLFQMVDGYPDMQQVKTDVFRSRVDYSANMKNLLMRARQQGAAAVAAIEAQLATLPGGLRDVEGGVMIDLFLSYRAVQSWQAMAALAQRMSRPLAGTAMVREQLALALNRMGESDEAEQVLLQLIAERGASSESQGILGRVYKDRWHRASQAGQVAEARGALNKAINAYLCGFEADWRDAYPGVNVLTLMEAALPPDPRRAELLPVVAYAVRQRIESKHATYWDYASWLEIEVLKGDEAAARGALDAALAEVRNAEDAKSTLFNLRIIADARQAAGIRQPWLERIMDELARRSGVAVVKP
jgi:tetratricopeptide (TPR) repeat protein